MAGKIDKPRKNIQHICEIKFVSCTLVAIIFVVYSWILMGVATLATTVMVPLMAGLNGGMSWRWYQCHCRCARVKMSQYSECTKSYASWYGSGQYLWFLHVLVILMIKGFPCIFNAQVWFDKMLPPRIALQKTFSISALSFCPMFLGYRFHLMEDTKRKSHENPMNCWRL